MIDLQLYIAWNLKMAWFPDIQVFLEETKLKLELSNSVVNYPRVTSAKPIESRLECQKENQSKND